MNSGSRKELLDDFDLVRTVLTNALTYPSVEKLGESGYQNAHKDLASALHSLTRIEKFCSRIDLDYLTPK